WPRLEGRGSPTGCHRKRGRRPHWGRAARSCSLLVPVDRDDLEGLRDAPDADLPGLGERKPRAGRGVPAGHDLAALRQRGDTGGLVDTLAGEVAPDLPR